MAIKKTPPTSGIMKYSPITTRVKGATGSGSSAASKGAAAVKKQPITSTKPATTQKQPAKKTSTQLPTVTVTAKKKVTPLPSVTVTAQKKVTPSNAGNPNKTYLVKDANGKNVEVTYSEWVKNKGKKTSLSNDASGFPIMQGTGGTRYTEYTSLKKKTTPKKS